MLRILAIAGPLLLAGVAAPALLSITLRHLVILEPILVTLITIAVVAIDRLIEARRLAAGRLSLRYAGRLLLEELFPTMRQHREEAVQAERRALAAELHDGILPAFGPVLADLDALPGVGGSQMAERLRLVTDDLRVLMSERRNPVLDAFGLDEALRARLEDIVIGSVAVSVDISALGRPPAIVERVADAVMAEAMRNAIAHASPNAVVLGGRISPTVVDLTFEDDGLGFSMDAARAALRRGHHGLVSMRERAHAVGASLSIGECASGPGTRVLFSWTA